MDKKRVFKKPFRCYIGRHEWVPSTTIIDGGDPIHERYCSHPGCNARQYKDKDGRWHKSSYTNYIN